MARQSEFDDSALIELGENESDKKNKTKRGNATKESKKPEKDDKDRKSVV